MILRRLSIILGLILVMGGLGYGDKELVEKVDVWLDMYDLKSNAWRPYDEFRMKSVADSMHEMMCGSKAIGGIASDEFGYYGDCEELYIDDKGNFEVDPHAVYRKNYCEGGRLKQGYRRCLKEYMASLYCVAGAFHEMSMEIGRFVQDNGLEGIGAFYDIEWRTSRWLGEFVLMTEKKSMSEVFGDFELSLKRIKIDLGKALEGLREQVDLL